jgi:hypothetical protein
MADTPDATPDKVVTTGITVGDMPHSPMVYFENAPAFGYINGLCRITLSAQVIVMADGQPVGHEVVVAYLRSNVQGMTNLRDAINGVLLAAAPTETDPNKAN